jgi:hypothetical protein
VSDQPSNVELDAYVLQQLEDMRHSDPDLLAGMLAAFDVIGDWLPDRPFEPTIRRYALLSEAGFRVFRFKNKALLREWRIFFFVLDAAKPRRAFIAAVVEYTSQDETYDDASAPHARRIRQLYLEFQTERLIRK